jgi:hypothetical protein
MKKLIAILGIVLIVCYVATDDKEVVCVKGTTLSSEERVEQECEFCNGTGWLPNGASIFQEFNNTTCWGEDDPTHICHKILCPRCLRAHCETLDLHRKCSACKGKGTMTIPKWMIE